MRAIFEAQSEYEDILRRDLLMAARSLADDVRVDPDLRRAILSRLLQVYFDSKSPRALQEDIRKVFARLGGTIVGRELLEALMERVAYRNRRVCRAAARALGQMGPAVATSEVLSPLLNLLADSERSVRRAAAAALGRMGPEAVTPEVLAPLLDFLADPDWDVRWKTATALGGMGQAAATPEVLSALLALLADPESDVRQAAAEALSNLSAYVCPRDRSEAVKLFLSLALSDDVDDRDTGYVGLRNLLAMGVP